MPPREMCWRCHKARVVCICDRVPSVETQTRLTIVQHADERFHPLGTARFAKLGLPNSRVVVRWLEGPAAQRPLPDLGPDATLLYPAPDARDLADLSPFERPTHLVILDGTWPKAKAIYKRTPQLQRLPAVLLNPQQPSSYRIRKEPALDCLSTIESIVAALRILEPENTAVDGLVTGFNAMIDEQIEIEARARKARGAPPRNWDGVRGGGIKS